MSIDGQLNTRRAFHICSFDSVGSYPHLPGLTRRRVDTFIVNFMFVRALLPLILSSAPVLPHLKKALALPHPFSLTIFLHLSLGVTPVQLAPVPVTAEGIVGPTGMME